MGYSAENLGRWVAERTDVHVSLTFSVGVPSEYEIRDRVCKDN
jgi:hypothetical protein